MLIARARDPQAAAALAGAIGAAAYVPVVVATWDVHRAALPYAAASAVIHVGYTALLALAYARADLSAVYPLARGSAPVLVLAASALVVGETVSAAQAAGVVAVAAGVLLVRGLRGEGDGRGGALGFAIGMTIAAYTVIDKQGVGHAAALPYLELLFAPSALVYLTAMARSRRGRLLDELRPLTALAGLGMLGAYGLTLAALKLGSAPGVAATRETSILVATAFGALFLKERVGPARALGAVAIVAGVAAVALG